ncbi:MAG: XRE family transcriptional regulator [Gammaproteobacteria bacterium]|nr:XRE family transcriptional regulator [Gammaproteobacteria bacterium]
MVGGRLKLARSAAGLSLRALEGRIGGRVTAQAIGKYERNESMPGSGVLIALAKALGVSVEYLTSEQDLALEAVEFRKKSIVRRREETIVQARVIDLLERYISVEELLSLHSVEWDKPREAPYPVVGDLSEVEQAAISLRTHWDLGRKPILSMVELLEECGVKVLALDLSDIGGMTAYAQRSGKSIDAVIVVNLMDSGERQRFTLTHELGHLVLTVDDRLNSEKAAQRFAGAFLMPADTVRTEIGRRRTSIGWSELFNLKRVFGVSVQAIVYRCRDLGIITDTLYTRLFRDISKFGWRTPPYPEPQRIKPERPSRFERLCSRALAENVISEAKAAELLGKSVRELHQWMEQPPQD